ncbi:dihydroorotase [Anaerovorax odorimutans]|uniref:Dihydroorotase n=1 Tax=Anaerovorax odorimutans TaxID=109327 RepID=A0ABT1RSI2_9FIRM|nr:dihydroorotase [Anaerovorax odorimutans]MCQ4638127.1 dihydroorotase [Anaerovorax odorimutans]
MKTLLKNGNIFTGNGFEKRDVFVIDGRLSLSHFDRYDERIDCDSFFIIPGLVDVHVHLREPGFFYKESIKTGTMAAARGGYTAVCAMPNLNPVPSTASALRQQLDIIERDAVIKVYPYGTITKEQNGRGALSDMEAMKDQVIAFSDDGKGVQTGELMEEAMIKAKALNKIIVAHCEDETLLDGGYIHDGSYAKKHGHKGICSESEWGQVKRDIELCKKTGARYHVCHISTKETVALIRQAKAEGVKITCETTPHYLIFCDEDLQEDGRFKMNPPIRSAEDREALIEGLLDGTIDVIATDHAPHRQEEKSRGLTGSAFGIVGLETAFPVLYTALVKTGKLSLEKLIHLMAVAPRQIFGMEGGFLQEGQVADLTVLDLEDSYRVNPEEFLSKGRSTPFEGMEVTGKTVATFVNGEKVYENKHI